MAAEAMPKDWRMINLYYTSQEYFTDEILRRR